MTGAALDLAAVAVVAVGDAVPHPARVAMMITVRS
jgi:hypothetical protein